MNNRWTIECIQGYTRVLVASLAASILMALILNFVNVLRNYGLPSADAATVGQISLTKSSNAVAALIDSYNSAMVGYARFGSGIGMIGGSFWALGSAKKYNALARIIVGLAAGGIIGIRLVMMITSDLPFIITSGVIGALWTSAYLYRAEQNSKFKSLPLIPIER